MADIGWDAIVAPMVLCGGHVALRILPPPFSKAMCMETIAMCDDHWKLTKFKGLAAPDEAKPTSQKEHGD